MKSALLEAQIVEETNTHHYNHTLQGYDDFCSNVPPLTSSGYLEAMIQYVKYCVDGNHNEEMLQILTIELTELNLHNLLKLNELIILICIYTTMILFGSCGSLLVVYTVIRKPKMRTPRNLFIVNLAISDLILCLFTQPFNLLRILYWHYDWKLGQIMCKSVAVGQAANIFVSTISIIAIALDRLQVSFFWKNITCYLKKIKLSCLLCIAIFFQEVMNKCEDKKIFKSSHYETSSYHNP
ncbi:unnamed protein product [Schistosoma margrebowiei]|uniref:Uncharacterized protein n=1 Tax=Schistosoma margrebowiei TaxID=48269 RepID=A0A183LV33_9TREM|nr:unnamed protein product [Schistosoma margrebowiei]